MKKIFKTQAQQSDDDNSVAVERVKSFYHV